MPDYITFYFITCYIACYITHVTLQDIFTKRIAQQNLTYYIKKNAVTMKNNYNAVTKSCD